MKRIVLTIASYCLVVFLISVFDPTTANAQFESHSAVGTGIGAEWEAINEMQEIVDEITKKVGTDVIVVIDSEGYTTIWEEPWTFYTINFTVYYCDWQLDRAVKPKRLEWNADSDNARVRAHDVSRFLDRCCVMAGGA